MSDTNRHHDGWEIQQLANRYCHYADTGRIEELTELFTEDGEWDGSAVMLGVHHGRAAMLRFMTGLGTHAVVGSCHLSSNHVIEFDGDDEAHGSVYTTSETRLGNGAIRLAFNLVTDTYRRTEGQWRFASRRIAFLMPPRMDPPDAPPLTVDDSKPG